MQVELAQLSLVDGDVAHNTRKVIDTIERVDVAGGTKLIVFPETTLSGFPTRENVAEVAETLSFRVLQWVLPSGGGCRVFANTRASIVGVNTVGGCPL